MKTLLLALGLVLTFGATAQTNAEVYLFEINLEQKKIQLSEGENISNNKGYDNQPSFYNDNVILFASTRNGQSDIAKYNIRDKTLTYLSHTKNGGEYSPLKIPKSKNVSAVRLDNDGKQRLYEYNYATGESNELIKDLVVAYYKWYDENTVVSSVIENGDLNLSSSNIKTGESRKYATNTGRSFHNIPNSKLVSFISKENDKWLIKSLNPLNGDIKIITETIKNSEDMCWLINGTLLMPKGNTIYKFNPKTDTKWSIFKTFKAANLQNITRISSNEIGTMLTLVSESYSKPKDILEPKLENISWISGKWHGEAFGGVTEEIWSEPSGGSMMASFKLINDGEVTFYEIEIIREIENTLMLQLKHFGKDLKGWETKDETVDFPLIEITENKVVFEGMTFEKISERKMSVYVDIKNEEGDVEIVQFDYEKEVIVPKHINQLISVTKAKTNPVIDGKAEDNIWSTSFWLPLDQLWLGNPYTSDDFSGRYKLSWSYDALYLLVEIEDDILVDNNPNPLVAWWDDDCLEIFIDADNSGGDHQYNHNAFAYHVALDGNVVDLSTNKKGKLYNSHLESKRITKGNTSIWEVKISLFDASYKEDDENSPLRLKPGQVIGFALAYCDNDTSETRENFIGSVQVKGDDKNRGWIDANIFGTLRLRN